MISKIVKFFKMSLTVGDSIFLSLISIIFVVLRFPSIFEPYWYGDEGIYEVIGISLNQGRQLYSQIWDNKPPVLYLIYALFNGDLFSVKLVSLLAGLGAVVVFYLITKKLFKNNISQIVSTVFFTYFLATPVIEGNIANAENFIILPTLLSFYLLFCSSSKSNLITFLAGVLLSISFLTKTVAVFDFISFFIILIGIRYFEKLPLNINKFYPEIKKIILADSKERIFILSFLMPLILTFAYFIFTGTFADFWKASFSENVSYVGYGNYFIIPMGFMILKIIFLILAIFVIFLFRKKLTKIGFIIFIWTAISLFDAFFSNRPYTHYLLVFLPSIAIFLGYAFENRRLLIITILSLSLVYLIVSSNFKFYNRIIPYYQNYISYIKGGDIEKYQTFFDPHTPRDYHVADFIKTHLKKDENIFLWGDSAQIYALSGKLPPGRYTVMYHITSYPNAIDETISAVEKSDPRFIIQTKDNPEISNFLKGYQFKYKIDDAIIYER